MKNLQNLIMALGMEPNFASALLILLFTFLTVITIFYTCFLFLLIGIRNEMIKMNSNPRALSILETKAKLKEKNESGSDDDKVVYEGKSSEDTIIFQLDDEDIKKLQAEGSEDP